MQDPDEAAMRRAVEQALDDETGSRARVATARALAGAMRDAGHLLWHVGAAGELVLTGFTKAEASDLIDILR